MDRRPKGWLLRATLAFAALAALCIAACGGGNNQAPVDTTAPRLWLPLHEGSGDVVHDQSGYGNDGTISGATWVQLSNGLWVLEFDSDDDRVLIEDDKSIRNLLPFTIGLWVWPHAETTYNHERLFAKGPAGLNQLLFYMGGRGRFVRNFEPTYAVPHSLDPVRDAETWFQYVAVLDADGLPRLYKNGVEIECARRKGEKTMVSDAGETLRLGGLPIDSGDPQSFRGRLGDVKYWARALTADEIRQEYESTRGMYP
ncbi:MAG: LamG-like jellyroll fold domain-containing protein [Dehalococcoidia bacterium]